MVAPAPSPPASQLAALLAARAVAARRRLAAAAFPLFVLAPMLAGAGLWVAGRYVELARDWLRERAAADPAAAAALLVVAGLVALVPAARRELLGLEPAHGFLAPQPISKAVRLAVAAVAVAARAVALALAAALALVATGGAPASVAAFAATFARLLPALLAVAALALPLAAAAIRLTPESRDAAPSSRRRRASGSLVARDLRLVVRRATPAAPFAVAGALVALGAVALRLPEAGLPRLLTLRLGALGGVLAALALAAVVPFLVAREVPRLWIEKTSGASFVTLVRARLATATVLGLAGALAGVAAFLAGPGRLDGVAPRDLLVAAGQILLAGPLAAAVVGAFVWETPSEPLLGLLFAAFLGLAPAILVVFAPAGWWLWAGAGGYLVHALAGRAPRRLRRLEHLETGA